MAVYLYRCDAGHEREVHHSVFDDSAVFCFECSQEMWRVPQNHGHVFKGNGFYSKDKS
jgi:hypothetical protein